MKLILILFLIISCSSTENVLKKEAEKIQTKHRPLHQQRLLVRPGYKGFLTNRICTTWHKKTCEQESVRKYSLKDEKIRNRLREFNFACIVGGKRYRICSLEPGYCRREAYKECVRWGVKLFTRKKVCREWGERLVEKYLDAVDDHDFLIDGATECKKGL